MLVRNEQEQDFTAVHSLNTEAFGSPAEADLVNALRKDARPVVSLVAEENGIVVGHIMFSPVNLSGHPDVQIMGLAPMAVSPAHQNRGIGSALVRAGLEECQRLGFGAVVVLGHPAYYPRFGFAPAKPSGIRCAYDAPDDAFMMLELRPGYLRGKSGTISYHAVFKNV